MEGVKAPFQAMPIAQHAAFDFGSEIVEVGAHGEIAGGA
jgi:hypothetical protein